MALPKLYDRITWHNNTTPALNEDNLNAMSQAIDDIDDRVIDLAGTIMEDVPQIIEDMAILEPAIESIDDNVARAEAAAESAEQYAEEIAPPIEVVKDYADIITVEDAINKPVKDLKVKIDPVQDLHGYTKPWVGGAGKNKANIADAVVTEAGYVYNNAPLVLPSGTYTFSFESTATSGDYTIVFRDADNTELARANKNMGVKYATFTLASACAKFTLAVSATGTYSHFQIEVGSTATTYESYSNICPITGHSEAKVARAGRNLLPQDLATIKSINTSGTWSGNVYTYYGGSFEVLTDNGNVIGIKVSGTFTENVPIKLFNGALSANSYILNGCPPDGGVNTYRLRVEKNGSGSYENDYGSGVSVSIAASDTVLCQIFVKAGTYTNKIFYPMLRLATDTNTTYEPYKGEVFTIDLGGTRYGGTLDVTSGVLTVTHKMVTINQYSWGISGDGTYFYCTDINDKKIGNYNLISSAYKTTTSDSASGMANGEIKGNASNYNIYLKDSSCATPTDLINNRGTEQIVYELATPQTIQLTAEEVELLLGYNTLWADTGDLSLTYDASGVLRIAGPLEERVDALESDVNAIDGIVSIFSNAIDRVITTSTSWSELRNMGTYVMQNVPWNGNWAIILVIKRNDNTGVEIAFKVSSNSDVSSSHIAYRMYYTGTYSNWSALNATNMT